MNNKLKPGDDFKGVKLICKGKRNSAGKQYWKWQCSHCHKFFYRRMDHVKCCDNNSCGCQSEAKYLCGQVTSEFWNELVRKAKRRDISVNITPDYLWCIYLEQQGLSSLSGECIYFNKNLSVDRIDSSKPYVDGNIQLVTKVQNMMKGLLNNPRFIHEAEKITKWQVKKKSSIM